MIIIFYYQLERSLACVYSVPGPHSSVAVRSEEGSAACTSRVVVVLIVLAKEIRPTTYGHGWEDEGGDDRAIKCHRRYRYSSTRSTAWVQSKPDHILIILTYHYGDCELIEPIWLGVKISMFLLVKSFHTSNLKELVIVLGEGTMSSSGNGKETKLKGLTVSDRNIAFLWRRHLWLNLSLGFLSHPLNYQNNLVCIPQSPLDGRRSYQQRENLSAPAAYRWIFVSR